MSIAHPPSLLLSDATLRARECTASALDSLTPGGKKGACRAVVHKSRFALETVRGIATVVELVTIGVCNWRHRQHPTKEQGSVLDDSLVVGNRRNGLLRGTERAA